MRCDNNAQSQRHGLGLLIVRQIADSHGGSTLMHKSSHGGFAVDILLPAAH